MIKYCCLLLLLILQGHTSTQLQEIKLQGTAQGTTYHITYYAQDTLFTKDHADSLFRSLDSSLSVYKPYSLITLFNKSVDGVRVDAHLKKVVYRSMEISADTRGVFDITVMPLIKLWGFGPEPDVNAMPTDAQINGAIASVGYDKIYFEKDSLKKKDPNVEIDIDGIAQGYSVDVIAQFLDQLRIMNYVVEVGGEIRTKGIKPGFGEDVVIGIEGPTDNPVDPILIRKIKVRDVAVTTSGIYRKYHTQGRQRLSHLIDIHTGRPLQNNMISVTVIAPDAITADGYDNALMNMDIQSAFEFISKRRFLSAYFIYEKKDGSVADTATPGFSRLFIR